MNKYLNTLDEEIKEYLKVLSPDFPEWMLEYIYTLQKCLGLMG